MPLFWKPYKSDISNFLDTLKTERPEIVEDQRRGRGLLWDRHIDRDTQAEFALGKVPQQPYVYQTRTEPE